MNSDITIRNVTQNIAADTRSRPTLLLIHHEKLSCIGIVRALEPGPIVLGRESSFLGPNVLADARVSRRHAQLTREGDRVFIEDLQSANGTTVDGREISKAGRVELHPGQIVGFGDLMLMLIEATPNHAPPLHPRLIGLSAAMSEVIEQISRVAPHNSTVLIQGETGCGKELVAKELHLLSGRKGPLVPVHCGGIADSLLTSELFGHVRGAFTGADRDRPGLIAAAEGGTLFLDEIGEASMALQVAMLRLLQEGEYRPVGSPTTRKADVRVIAATHRDLTAMVDAGTFREDLYARLARWPIEIRPLRERREDIPLLALHLANRHAPKPVRLHRSLVTELLRHRWSRNVRELDAWMERAVVNAAGDPVLRPDADMLAQVEPEAPKKPEERAPRRAPGPRPSADALREAIREHNGNMKAVAGALGVSRNTLYRWFGEVGIDPHTVRRAL